MMIDREVQIFTDGACRGNPGLGPWGTLISSGKTEKELWGGEFETTNNMTELTLAIRKIEALNQASSTVLKTDLRYFRKGITQWIKDWKNVSEQPVKNQDLWELQN
jgi:ribonuclease HI